MQTSSPDFYIFWEDGLASLNSSPPISRIRDWHNVLIFYTMHFFHINDIYQNKFFDAFKSLWKHFSFSLFQLVSAGSFRFISCSTPFGVFLALFWYSVIQNLWYLISFTIKLMLDIFRSIFSSSNQLAYFLVFTSKLFVLACTNFCSLFLTVALSFPQNIHVLGKYSYPIGFI